MKNILIRGKGTKHIIPEIILSLLFYGYATGVFSSRKIEKATYDKLVKSRHKDHRWLDKKFDIQGVVFLAGSRLYA